jgi:hypothetical protein
MKKILEIISYLSLILIVAAPILYYMGKLTLEQNKLWMLVATIIWFGTASFWIGTKKEHSSGS